VRRFNPKAIGVCSALAYAANALHYGWTPSLKTPIDDLRAGLTLLAVLAFYVAGYQRLRREHAHSFAAVMLPAIPLLAICFITIPYDSTDVFLYMDIGWAQAHYGINPYSQVLHDIPEVARDPMVRTDWMVTNKNPWLDLPFVYGFLFARLTKGIARVGNGHWWLTLALFKSLNVAAYLLCAGVVWRLAKASGDLRPDLSLYLFAWSPLILQHHIANAHNDLVVGCLVVIATYLLSTEHDMWAPAVLLASAMIKYVTLPLVPLCIWFIGRRRGWTRAVSALLMTIPVLALSLPYLAGSAAFRFDLISAQLVKTTAGSLYAFLFYIYRFTARFMFAPVSAETFGFVLKMLLWFIGAAIVAVEGYRFCRRTKPALDDWITTSSWILFSIVFIASSQFYSWYLGMFFPLVLLMRTDHWLRSFSVLAGGTHVFSLTSLSRKGIGYFLLTLAAAVGTAIEE
jgi:hypothetical protein